MLIKLVVNIQDAKGTRHTYTNKYENARSIPEARRLAKNMTAKASGWCEVIGGDYEWYEHYENGVLMVEQSKQKATK